MTGDLPTSKGASGGTAAGRSTKGIRHGVARAISKLGMGSRSQAARWVQEGRVQVNGRVVRDPQFPVLQGVDRVEIEGQALAVAGRRVLMLNPGVW